VLQRSDTTSIKDLEWRYCALLILEACMTAYKGCK
jgi:hypothetical protein